MNSLTDGITVDAGSRRAHPFLRRRVADAFMLHLIDGLMLFAAVIAGDWVLYWTRGVPVQVAPFFLLIPAWWVGSWLSRLVPGWGLGTVEELRRIQILLAVLFSMALLTVFLQGRTGPQGLSRISFFAAYLFSAVLVPCGRILAKKMLAGLNLWGVPAVVYGSRDAVPEIVSSLKADRSLGFVPKAVFSDEFRQGEIAAGLPVLGRLCNTTRRAPVAVVALPDMPRHELIGLLEGPLQVYRTILLVPDLQDAPSLWVRPCDLQGILGLEIQRNLLDPVALSCKIGAERLLVLLTFPLWGPVCLLFMFLVWLQDFHSPIYTQTRVGRNCVRFKAYKLRTMVPDAEKVLLRRLARDPELKAEWEQHYKLKKDPRITWVGQLLRKTSLDELPQLWCVLRGKMALVGPRPLPDYHHNELQMRTQRLRTQVLPGITGLWQVSGRSDCGTAGMDKWDTYYVTNWSIWLDIVILARTVRVVLFGSGAY